MSDYMGGVFFVFIVTKDDIKGSSRPEAVNVYSGSVHLFISVLLPLDSLLLGVKLLQNNPTITSKQLIMESGTKRQQIPPNLITKIDHLLSS